MTERRARATWEGDLFEGAFSNELSSRGRAPTRLGVSCPVSNALRSNVDIRVTARSG